MHGGDQREASDFKIFFAVALFQSLRKIDEAISNFQDNFGILPTRIREHIGSVFHISEKLCFVFTRRFLRLWQCGGQASSI